MGAIQEPTSDMGPYRTEIRGESFYLARVGEGASHLSRHEVRVPAAEIPALLAALKQATDHLGYRQWAASNPEPPDASWVLPPGEKGEAPYPDWSVSRERSDIIIRGPWVAYPPEEWQERPVVTGEIAYWDVEALRGALLAADARASGRVGPVV
ncbi:hypothetical protein ACIBAI_05925 [Streptomyces sp. NPDC051041]|uniref:hypothetical protein n=1 Tax=Streptomyces sp. NPDC051041 TaxID=3365640 RepID=UPI0037BB6C07